MNAKPTGVDLILAERTRQIKKGWTSEHDDNHEDGSIADAAACYTVAASAGARGADAEEEFTASMLNGYSDSLLSWPWDEKDWKPSADPIHNLVKAGALVAAEIDRLNRLKA